MKSLSILIVLLLPAGWPSAGAQTEPSRSREAVPSEARAPVASGAVAPRGESSASELPPPAKSKKPRSEGWDETRAGALTARPGGPVRTMGQP
jgi:hypothetical protein